MRFMLMRRKSYLPLALVALLLGNTAQADTAIPPKGVRALVYQYINADVPSSFGSAGVESDFSIKETLGASVIRSISPTTASAYDELAKISPELASEINLGKIDLNPKINVKAHVFGLAWGLNDWLMVAGGFPMMNASVDVSGGYINTGAITNTALGLNSVTDPSVAPKASAMAQVLQQSIEPILRGEVLQGIIVNEFQYKPVGDWTASGIGDTSLFLQALAINWDFYKNGYKLGVELPTGRKDDPDNLVDVPFGKGYTASFAEILNDFFVIPEYLTLSLNARYQYNWAADRTFRLAPSTSFPLSAEKENINYKPGNAWGTFFEASTRIARSVSISTGYSIKEKSKDSIRGIRRDYDYGILEHATASRTNAVMAKISYSTVDMFLRNKFPMPFKVGATVSRVVSGINTERVNQVSLDFEMYF